MAGEAEETQTYKVVIRASAQAIWDALTRPEWSERYGYGGRVAYEMKPGGRFRHEAAPEMKAMGMPEEMIVGEVVEADAPRALTFTWHPVWDAASAAEPHTRVTYRIAEHQGGICTLTLTHDVTGAPIVAAMIPGQGDPSQGGGGWPWILSDLKTLLETGSRMVA